MNGRAVITGMGIVSSIGVGTGSYWRAAQAGTCGIKRITGFDTTHYDIKLAGQVSDFNATDFIERRLMLQTDRFTWMALAGNQMALKDADFDPAAAPDPYAMSVITASSSGGNEFGQKEIQALWGNGFVGAFQSIAWFYAASTGQLSIKHGVKGPNSVIVSEGAGGLDALGHARRTISRGVKLVMCGGTEAPLSPYALTCQQRSGRLSPNADPETAYRPFDAGARGYVPGEGGAMLVVEDLVHALHRGAPTIYGEIVGHASTQDAYHPSRVATDGVQYARAISLALQRANVCPEAIDAIFLDGAGTLEADFAEVRAIKEVFGASARQVPVTVPKTMVGRLYSGAGALDVATALLSIRDGWLPPTIHLENRAPGCDLNFVTGRAQRCELNTVLVCARGFGGFNSALVLRRFRG